uniref:hypothetical protein n=1 Tax=uncultured Halomonas sp. TaxID=173971 RepID=UPI0026316DF4|nr:hypothetical protein [uncultured Halomonas sp.]
MAHAFSAQPKEVTPEQATAIIGHWYRQACEHRVTLVVSAEAIYRHVLGSGSFWERRRYYLEALRTALADFEVIPVVVFRRPDDYLRSLYQEAVANLSKPRQMPAFADYVAKPPPGVHYSANAELVESVFGSLRVLLYEDLTASPGSLGEAFYAALGYSLSGHTPTSNVRVSLSPEETLLKNAFNGQLASRAESDAFIRGLRTPRMQDILRTAYPTPPYSLWPDTPTRQAFLDSRADDLAQLRQRYFPERDTLFEASIARLSTHPVPMPSPELLDRVKSCVPAHHES